MSLRVLLERLTKQREVQILTDHLVKTVLFGGETKVEIVPQSIKKMQKTVYMNMLTIDNVTVKNIAKVVLRYFLMRKGHFKKVKKKYTYEFRTDSILFIV